MCSYLDRSSHWWAACSPSCSYTRSFPPCSGRSDHSCHYSSGTRRYLEQEHRRRKVTRKTGKRENSREKKNSQCIWKAFMINWDTNAPTSGLYLFIWICHMSTSARVLEHSGTRRNFLIPAGAQSFAVYLKKPLLQKRGWCFICLFWLPLNLQRWLWLKVNHLCERGVHFCKGGHHRDKTSPFPPPLRREADLLLSSARAASDVVLFVRS